MRHEWSDVELVQGLRRGSDVAAQVFIDTYSTPLYRYLRRRCRCEEDANDVLSMLYQKVVASIHTYRAELGSFKNWLYQVARTCLIDFFREQGRRPAPPPGRSAGGRGSLRRAVEVSARGRSRRG